MKRFLYVVFALVSVHANALDSPEVIEPKTKIIRPVSWYSTQAKRWSEKVAHEASNAHAWLNYYSASRYALSSQSELNIIAEQAQKVIAGTFEANVIKALNDGYTENSFKLLTEAYTANAGKAETYGPLMLFQEFYLNDSERQQFSRKLLASGNVSQALLSYSYNVLMSIEENAVLFIDGDNTTLPLFILQDVMNVRKDVVVLNLDLLTTQRYLDLKLKKSGLLLTPSSAQSVQRDQKKMICSLLPEQNPSKKFYYALTIGRDNISEINNQLYVVGLASQVSKERLDNISVIKQNLEKRFLLDYLTVDFNGESEFAAGRVLSSNYLVSMLLLHEHYTKNGELEKSAALRIIVERIAAETGKEILVKNILDPKVEDLVPFIPFGIDYKQIDNTVRMISNTLYAQDHEVTNEEYNVFLKYLNENKLGEQYEKYKFDLSTYEEPALSLMKGYSSAGVIAKKQKFRYPAVNISYDAANAYCEWLTEQYNNSADRKFKKVKFRLPKLNEWQIAAASIVNPVSWDINENSAEVRIYANGRMAGKDFEKKTVSLSDPEILYPWFRHFTYRNNPANSFGCYLGNFKIPDDVKPCQAKKMTTADGWIAMAPVQTYFPNDIGLFDMVGNVAEMTDENGKACGGSWNHPASESTIKSINEYKGPDSATGFRIFMDVIQK
ncbi:MAG: SUMF1/EgtB/PvdO family nonheme iron enzyme [Bacteroidota bacterium]